MNVTDIDIIKQKLEDFGPERWLEALQSSHYRHIRSQLGYVQTNSVRACCLGVLVHAAGAYHLGPTPTRTRYVLVDEMVCGETTLSIPDGALPSWLDAYQRDDLVKINDDDKTYDYTEQMAYIAENILPEWRAEKILTEGV